LFLQRAPNAPKQCDKQKRTDDRRETALKVSVEAKADGTGPGCEQKAHIRIQPRAAVRG